MSDPNLNYLHECLDRVKFIPFPWEGEDRNLAAFRTKDEFMRWYCQPPGVDGEPYRDRGFYTRELAMLSRIVRPSLVVEMGTSLGIGTCLLRWLNPTARLVTVDVATETFMPGNQRVPIGHLAKLQGFDCEYVCGNSWDYRSCGNVCLCFIDADHTYGSVIKDSERACKCCVLTVIVLNNFTEDVMERLLETFTSTGSKFFYHQEAMNNLRNKKGQCVTTHCMLTDICQHTCAFCSVQARAGDSLPFDDVMAYLDILLRYGLKSVILSGGGNPILYRCKVTGRNFKDIVYSIHARGLEIGLITNGMPLRTFGTRESWGTVRPETLDKLTWVRISMAGLDHDEGEVYVPDIDPTKTTLGFSYVAHDIYKEVADPHHGKVSTRLDLISGDKERAPDWSFESRISELTAKIDHYVEVYSPRYVRLLPNCLEPKLIPQRCEQLQHIADEINLDANREVVFVQNKPPKAPKACYLGYIHPVLNCDGYVYPCDSCVLNETAEHRFANPWRVCRWDEVAQLYERPVHSLIADPAKTCPGCVFHRSNEILGLVVDGTTNLMPPSEKVEHANFV